MQKISITVDLTKIDKSKIIERKYENKNGEMVTVKEYRMEVVPVREENQKLIKTGPNWKMVKTHFVADTQTKEERESGKKSTIFGDGIQFFNTDNQVDRDFDNINQDRGDIPF